MRKRALVCILTAAVAVAACKKKPAPGDDDDDAIPDTVLFVAAADADGDGLVELYGYTRGGFAYALSSQFGAGHDVTRFQSSPDHAWISMVVEGGNEPGLYVVPITGGTPTLLSTPGQDINTPVWSPDSSQIAYTTGSPGQMIVVNRDGSGSTVSSTGDVRHSRIEWSPAGNFIAYRSDTSGSSHYLLHTVRPNGMDDLVLASTAAANGTLRITDFQWAPIGDTVAFVTDAAVAGTSELFVAPDDRVPVQVSVETGSAGTILANTYTWTPNAGVLYYRRDATSTGTRALWSVTRDGLSPTKVSPEIAEDVTAFIVSPSRGEVIYKMGNTALYRGGTELVTAGFITKFQWAPDAGYVAYIAGAAINGPFDVYTLAPGGSPIQVDDSNFDVDDLNAYVTHVVYESDNGVYAVAPDGGTPVRLDDDTKPNVYETVIHPPSSLPADSDIDIDIILFEQYIGTTPLPNPDDTFRVERVWAEVTTTTGQVEFGRRESTWGMGLYSDAGSRKLDWLWEDQDSDFGDSVDRVRWILRFADGEFAHRSGNTTAPAQYSQEFVVETLTDALYLRSLSVSGQMARGTWNVTSTVDPITFTIDATEIGFGGRYECEILESDPNTMVGTYTYDDGAGGDVVYDVSFTMRPFL